MPELPELVPQEISYDHPDSCHYFRPIDGDVDYLTFTALPRAIEIYSLETIVRCLAVLQKKAADHDGLADFQMFGADHDEPLCFVEGYAKESIAAFVPREY